MCVGVFCGDGVRSKREVEMRWLEGFCDGSLVGQLAKVLALNLIVGFLLRVVDIVG